MDVKNEVDLLKQQAELRYVCTHVLCMCAQVYYYCCCCCYLCLWSECYFFVIL